MLGSVYELFVASRFLIIVRFDSAFERFDMSTENGGGFFSSLRV